MIAVCPLSRLSETIAAARARRVLSLLSQDMAAPSLPGIAPDDHLTLRFHDIVEPMSGYVHPCESHVAEALAFAVGPAPIVVHCYAGISRSTAMAFAIACAREPSRNERELAAALRRASPMATPNRLIVRLADDALGRRGRMSAAIAAIGRGEDAFEGFPFTLTPSRAP